MQASSVAMHLCSSMFLATVLDVAPAVLYLLQQPAETHPRLKLQSAGSFSQCVWDVLAYMQEALVCYCCIQLHLGGLTGLHSDSNSHSEKFGFESTQTQAGRSCGDIGASSALEELYELVLREVETDGARW